MLCLTCEATLTSNLRTPYILLVDSSSRIDWTPWQAQATRQLNATLTCIPVRSNFGLGIIAPKSIGVQDGLAHF